MERHAIFRAALRLINDGKFQAVSLAEVGYYANLTERTTRYFFESKERLIEELCEEVLNMIQEVYDQSTVDCRSFENFFFDTWISLYEFYVRNPQLIAFVEQAGVLTTKHDVKFMDRLLTPLKKFFQTNAMNLSNKISSGPMVALFHGNIIAAAKLHDNPGLSLQQYELRHILQILWTGVTMPALDKDETLMRIAN